MRIMIDRTMASWRARGALAPGRRGAPDSGTALLIGTIRIREMGPCDRQALDEVFEGMSANSRYLRYHTGLSRLNESLRRAMLNLDGQRHVAMVAEAATTAGWRAIGIVRLVRTDEYRAEIAAEVVDEWQRRGVCRTLLRTLSERAVQLGYTELYARLLPCNRAVLALLPRVFPNSRIIPDGVAYSARVALRPRTEAGTHNSFELTEDDILADLIGPPRHNRPIGLHIPAPQQRTR